MNKKLAAAAVGASLLTGAGAGALLSIPGTATAQAPASSAATAATAAATTPTPPAPPWVTDALKKLVDAGTITQAQSDAILRALLAAAPPGRGPGRPGRAFGHGRHELGDDVAIAANAIGISAADLRSALDGGQTIAQVAKAHNVDVQKVIDALVADEKAELAAEVKNGDLTQAQADQISSRITQSVTDRVNGTPRGGFGHRGGHGWGPPSGTPAPGSPTPAPQGHASSSSTNATA